MSLNHALTGNWLRWHRRRRPFFEIYYLKCVDPAQGWSLWIRYTLNVPKKGGETPTASLWGIFCKGSPQKLRQPSDLLGEPEISKEPLVTVALKETVPLHQIDPFHAERFIQIKENFLSLDEACGALTDSDHFLNFRLTFEDPTISAALYPYSSFYTLPFPKTKFLEPRLSSYLSGSFTVDHEVYHLNHLAAHQAHLWGTGYAKRWAWGHCNQFQEDPTVIFEGLTAQIGLSLVSSPPLSLFYFVVDGKTYKANGFWHWFKNKSHYDLAQWKFSASGGDLKFEGKLQREPLHLVGVEYVGPLGEKRYCHSTMLASMELKIYKKKKGNWRLYKTLHSQAAAFETVEPNPDPRVHFVL